MNTNCVSDLEVRVDQEAYSFEEVMKAVEEGRIVQGVVHCAQALEMDPENVLLCVLSEEGSNDISVQIQHTLIEAYCWENEISIQKVGPDDKLRAILARGDANLNKNMEDHTCSLVMRSTQDIDFTEVTEQDPWLNSDILLPG